MKYLLVLATAICFSLSQEKNKSVNFSVISKKSGKPLKFYLVARDRDEDSYFYSIDEKLFIPDSIVKKDKRIYQFELEKEYKGQYTITDPFDKKMDLKQWAEKSRTTPYALSPNYSISFSRPFPKKPDAKVETQTSKGIQARVLSIETRTTGGFQEGMPTHGK